MPNRKRTPSATRPTRAPRFDGLAGAEDAAWQEMRRSIEAGIADGSMASATNPETVEVMRRLLDEHDALVHALFSGGFQAAIAILAEGMALAVRVVPHDCDVPGHNHGPSSRIGRA